MPIAWIVASGTELTLGQSIDTNSAWLAQRLAELGIVTTRHLTVGDAMTDLCDCLRTAAAQADLVVLSGGLGPTDDDLTRAALADVAASPLVLDAESLAQIRAWFAARGREMPERNQVQAQRPAGSEALPNPRGTAPGIAMRIGHCDVFALPGVPSEMRGMFVEQVVPRLGDRFRSAGVVQSRRLNCFGKGESDIGGLIRDLMARGRNPEVGTTAADGIIGVRINARAAEAATAAQMLDVCEATVRERLGTLVFGRQDETLAHAVAPLLIERGETIAVAESCTGGLLGAMLTDVPGSSRFFVGGFLTYSNQAKTDLAGIDARDLRQFGAVSEPVASALASAARQKLGAAYGVAITGVAGPTGGSPDKPVGCVWIAWAGPRGVQARQYLFGSDSQRDAIRRRACHAALNQLRLELLGVR